VRVFFDVLSIPVPLPFREDIMAIFKITSATNRLNSAGDAFGPPADDSPGADTLIVDPGAFLISTAVGGTGAFFANTGAWTVTVNGSIVSQGFDGIILDAGNTAVSTIKIGASGAVQGDDFGIFLGSSANINNAGTVSGGTGIEMFNGGTHRITNSGIINGTAFSIFEAGGSIDTVRNSGRIIGTMSLGGGNDIVTNFAIVGDVIKSGTIIDTISLGGGDDKFTGGANLERVADENGADIVSLGGGRDTYIATGNTGADGIDTVKGGAGIDTYDASGATSALGINLDTVAHDFAPFFPGTNTVAANTATGPDIAGSAKDAIFGFENANGGAGSDIIYGSGAGNVLNGGPGTDDLFGFGGNDTLDAGAGNDSLIGGPGKDQLTGGLGPDAFLLFAFSDSGITAPTRDLIADFEQGIDKIDLHFLDANKTTAADDAFTFVGTNILTGFSGNPGELHAFWSAVGQIVEGDVNGDKKADFSIELSDPTHAITLTNTSFIL
jgi:Ca2+-binding RTX toxin-like protein